MTVYFAGWNADTNERTRSRFKNDIATHICDLAKETDGSAAGAETMVAVVADVLQQKLIAPHVQVALNQIAAAKNVAETNASSPPAAAAAPAVAPITEKKALIDADTAIKLRYTAGTRTRGEQAYRNKMGNEHVPITKITKRMNDLFGSCCPTPFFPGKQFLIIPIVNSMLSSDSQPMAVNGPETVEKLLEMDTYWNMILMKHSP